MGQQNPPTVVCGLGFKRKDINHCSRSIDEVVLIVKLLQEHKHGDVQIVIRAKVREKCNNSLSLHQCCLSDLCKGLTSPLVTHYKPKHM